MKAVVFLMSLFAAPATSTGVLGQQPTEIEVTLESEEGLIVGRVNDQEFLVASRRVRLSDTSSIRFREGAAVVNGATVAGGSARGSRVHAQGLPVRRLP